MEYWARNRIEEFRLLGSNPNGISDGIPSLSLTELTVRPPIRSAPIPHVLGPPGSGCIALDRVKASWCQRDLNPLDRIALAIREPDGTLPIVGFLCPVAG